MSVSFSAAPGPQPHAAQASALVHAIGPGMPPEASAAMHRALRRAMSVADLRAMARRRLPRAVFEFYEGGAEDESTLDANRAAFAHRPFVPRYLVDVSQVSTAAPLLGVDTPMPLAISPTGAIGFGWPLGDVAIARAAREAGVPYALPTSSTSSIERVARDALGARLWFQAYMLRQRDYTMGLIERARLAGYEALIITIDMPTGGKRERDMRNDFGLPFRFTPRNVLDFARRPSWVLAQLRQGLPQLENLIGFTPEAVDAKTIASSVGKSYDPSFDWTALARIRDAWPRKLLLKGVLHPQDALLAERAGCDGVIVSNHGGRQLDGAVATLDALPGVVAAVGGRMEVLLDGGVRRGGDIVKALALGANGVMVGRPALYGAAAAGQAGVARMLQLLHDEMTRTLRLTGRTGVAALGADIFHGQASMAPPEAGAATPYVTTTRHATVGNATAGEARTQDASPGDAPPRDVTPRDPAIGEGA
jgi:(S)-mandelate dehydrogenase